MEGHVDTWQGAGWVWQGAIREASPPMTAKNVTIAPELPKRVRELAEVEGSVPSWRLTDSVPRLRASRNRTSRF